MELLLKHYHHSISINMKDQLITFKTAKLAKEKGFNIFCLQAYRVYRENIRKKDKNPLEEIQGELDPYVQYPFPEIVYFSQSTTHTLAPTQSLLQKWLREVHNIDIKIDVNINRHVEYYYFPSIVTLAPNKLSVEESEIEGLYSIYEEALEAGLQEALKLI